MSGPVSAESILGRIAPSLVLPDSSGGSFRLEDHLERGPVVLFFFIHNGTPG
jgi:peroxiredoxin